MDTLSRILLVSFFIVNYSHAFYAAVTTGIKLKDESASRLKRIFITISCYFTYIAVFVLSAVIVINVDPYKTYAALYLIGVLALGILKQADFWKSEGEARIQKIMIFATNLSLCGGLLIANVLPYEKPHSTDIELPKAGVQAIVSDEQEITLTLTRDGIIKLGKDLVPRERLEEVISSNPRIKAEKRILLRLDPGMRYQDIVKVMELLKRAGVNDVGIATEPDAGGHK